MARWSNIGVPISAAAVCAAAGQAEAGCPVTGQEKVVVQAVEPRLELRLADGRLIRLTGLDPALHTPSDPALADTTRAKFEAAIAGKPLALAALSPGADRWGRLSAFAFEDSSKDSPGGLATAAIGLGFGRYLAEPPAHACRDALVGAEQRARAAKLGLWRDPYYGVLSVDDRAGFAERSGTIVVAEGRLTAVQPSPYRTTLRFAAADDTQVGSRLVATIPPRVMKTFESRQVNLRALIGQRLRFRGLLDLRFGPRIELASPDEIEPIPAGDAAAPPPG